MKRTLLHSIFVFLAVYGAMNGYCYWRLTCWLRPPRAVRIGMAILMAILTFGELITHRFEHADWAAGAFTMALASYFWMAFLLWFDLLAGLLDGWNLALFFLARRRPAAARWAIPFRPGMAAVAALVGLIMLYSLVEAQRIRVVPLQIRSPHFRGAPLRILQISDVHLGLIERNRRLSQIVGLVERTHPDLLIASGDLLDGSGIHMSGLQRRLAAIQPPLGKVAIMGNHEYYNGIRKSTLFLDGAGFRLLRGSAMEVAEGRVRLVGVDDPTGLRLGVISHLDNEPALLGPLRPDQFTILLKHQPYLNPGSLGRFDLMLSGHTHQGQILPFGLILWTAYPYFSGTHELPQGGVLHISRGTGTWGPPMRFGAPPEVTLITLEGA